MKYGFSGLIDKFKFKLSGKLLSGLLAVRVKNIVLDNTYHNFEELGGWNALGAIEYSIVNSPTQNSNINKIAYPLNSNCRNFPLINEIVYIISLPSTDIGENNNALRVYYINNIGLWNHPHHNAYPLTTKALRPSSQQKDYTQTQAGSVRRVTDDSTEINLGKTFKERANIHPLLPFEGDIIYEGRWGQSIRFGSTVKIKSNNWSITGDNGDPITIIRNGQGKQTDQGWIPVAENINNDDSSIYITSTQKIPLDAASVSYVSYIENPPIVPSEYSGGAQIILDSGRLIFNAYDDHILLSSAKSINLNSQESVNIDTEKFIVNATKIFLGREDLAIEPLLLGDTTVNLLKDLIGALKELSTVLQSAQTTPTIPTAPAGLPTINLAAISFSTKLDMLNEQLGSSPKNCTITSKRNFTI